MADFPPLNAASPLMDVTAEAISTSSYPIILKLTEPPCTTASSFQQSPRVLSAMQQLIQVIEQLRSPHSGWDASLPQTPGNLLPYVTEEAYDLLDALEESQDSQPQPASVELGLSPDLWQHHCSLEDLPAQLLWGIVRSAHEGMRLMEGVFATVTVEGRSQQGILRLSPVLDLAIAGHQQSRDLVTHQPPPSVLPDDALISTQTDLYPPETSVGDLVRSLTQQIQLNTPSLSPFLAGMTVKALVPQQTWQPGRLKLWLGFELIEMAGTAAIPTPGSTEELRPRLCFTSSNWLENFSAMVMQRHLSHLIPRLSAFRAIAQSNMPLAPEEAVRFLVSDACSVADLLNHALTFKHHRFLTTEIGLEDLISRLLWCVSRSAYEVMQLMGGIPCRLLQPEAAWEEGILRLLVTLKLKTPEMDWYFDLATGQLPQPQVFPLGADVVVQSPSSQWCLQPDLIQQLENQVMQNITQATPELQLLLSGTDVDFLGAEGDWQPATLQMQIDFDFMPR